MKTLELLNILLHLDPDLMVTIDGYEGGATEVVRVEIVNINMGANKEWWYGEHEYSSSGGTKAIKLVGNR